MFIKTEAIVISSLKYNDTDLIVKCYTKSLGSVSFMVKGVLKSRKGKYRASMFQALSLIDIEMQYRNKGQLEYFKEIHFSNHLNELQSNVYKSSIVMFLSEVLKSVIIEEEQNENLFEFLKSSILHLDSASRFANFHISFILKLTSFLGFYPHAPSKKSDVYFNLSEGLFQEFESPYTLNFEQSAWFLKVLKNSFENNQDIKFTKAQRIEILSLLMKYYELHIENFRNPKSLEVIKQIFN